MKNRILLLMIIAFFGCKSRMCQLDFFNLDKHIITNPKTSECLLKLGLKITSSQNFGTILVGNIVMEPTRDKSLIHIDTLFNIDNLRAILKSEAFTGISRQSYDGTTLFDIKRSPNHDTVSMNILITNDYIQLRNIQNNLENHINNCTLKENFTFVKSSIGIELIETLFDHDRSYKSIISKDTSNFNLKVLQNIYL